jgi:serine/threonine protein kinase
MGEIEFLHQYVDIGRILQPEFCHQCQYLTSSIESETTLQQRFEREVLLAREVPHPNLCPIYDVFHREQSPPSFSFLTMKLLPGETLAARLHRPVSMSA